MFKIKHMWMLGPKNVTGILINYIQHRILNLLLRTVLNVF